MHEVKQSIGSQPTRVQVLNGAMIIAGTAIGAGMLANPTATSGVWFIGSVFLLIYVWFHMYLSGLMLLEANQHFPLGSSFHTMVAELLGPRWNLICGIAIVFVLYALTYAYIFVGGGLTQAELEPVAQWLTEAFPFNIELNRVAGSTIFLVVLAACVICSTHWVGWFSSMLIIGMLLSFALSTSDLLAHVRLDYLLDRTDGQVHTAYWPYLWIAIPVCLASFGFHGNVSSLRDYFQGNSKAVARSILIGSGLALCLYIVWQWAVHGNLARAHFGPVIAADGDVNVLLTTINAQAAGAGVSQLAQQALGYFAYMAIASSFLGVTLGLFDYMRDLFGFNAQLKGRLQTAAVTFLPPYVAYLFMPTGFVQVMGYVGLMAAIWAVLVPALLVRKSRQVYPQADYPQADYRVLGRFGGDWTLYAVVFFAILVIAIQVLHMLGWVPVFLG